MKCPKCGNDNGDSAKFCKKCGSPLKSSIDHQSMISSMSKSESNDTTKYIIIALIIIVVALAGAFAFIYMNSNSHDSTNDQSSASSQATPQTPTPSSSQASPTPSNPMSILGGSFSTGSGLEDKTYAKIYVGSQHAGESCTIQIYYSRDGSTLNNGNMVPVTVDSNGYISVSSADAYDYFPDQADINLYDSNGNLVDTKTVYLSPTSGTQTF